jgi:hypothetical protein
MLNRKEDSKTRILAARKIENKRNLHKTRI